MFELFAETLERIPPKAVQSLLKREFDTLEDALLHQRISETFEINSVLCFCQFMATASQEEIIFPASELPVRHIAFYRKILLRLVEAGELPPSARAKFDMVFSAGFLRNLASH